MDKKSINVKEIMADIRVGMDDAALEEKYQLSAYQLKTLFEQLVKNGSLQTAELYNREPAGEKPPTTEWECPVCHTLRTNELEVCPKCKVYVPMFWKAQPGKQIEKEGESVGEDRSRTEITVALPWKCPACGMPQFKEYEECPQCGVVVARFGSKQPPEQEAPETLVPEPSGSSQSGEEGGTTKNFRVSQERTGPSSSFFDDKRLLVIIAPAVLLCLMLWVVSPSKKKAQPEWKPEAVKQTQVEPSRNTGGQSHEEWLKYIDGGRDEMIEVSGPGWHATVNRFWWEHGGREQFAKEHAEGRAREEERARQEEADNHRRQLNSRMEGLRNEFQQAQRQQREQQRQQMEQEREAQRQEREREIQAQRQQREIEKRRQYERCSAECFSRFVYGNAVRECEESCSRMYGR